MLRAMGREGGWVGSLKDLSREITGRESTLERSHLFWLMNGNENE